MRQEALLLLAQASSYCRGRSQHRGISVISDAFGPLPPRQHRRVVVTGLGTVSPLGTSVPETWQAILQGVSGIRALQAEDLPEVTASQQLWLRSALPHHRLSRSQAHGLLLPATN